LRTGYSGQLRKPIGSFLAIRTKALKIVFNSNGGVTEIKYKLTKHKTAAAKKPLHLSITPNARILKKYNPANKPNATNPNTQFCPTSADVRQVMT